ncbi:hypothetical protein LJC32_01110 [Oscillospiraceae bacterium OttesenSCG-928-F05]|nr:hypothetical protein [Oscillospiraceae bacterium OttesenSCG-928-F05]
MFINLPFFKDKKQARLALVFLGILTLIFLIAALVPWSMEQIKMQTYHKVISVVTDYDTRDGNNVWTEFQYEYAGEIYTVRLKGHSYWMKPDSEIELLVNPAAPDEAEVLANYGALPPIRLMGAGLFGAVFLFYLINYIVAARRCKKF